MCINGAPQELPSVLFAPSRLDVCLESASQNECPCFEAWPPSPFLAQFKVPLPFCFRKVPCGVVKLRTHHTPWTRQTNASSRKSVKSSPFTVDASLVVTGSDSRHPKQNAPVCVSGPPCCFVGDHSASASSRPQHHGPERRHNGDLSPVASLVANSPSLGHACITAGCGSHPSCR
jgi:hypothetical protein